MDLNDKSAWPDCQNCFRRLDRGHALPLIGDVWPPGGRAGLWAPSSLAALAASALAAAAFEARVALRRASGATWPPPMGRKRAGSKISAPNALERAEATAPPD